MKSGSLLLPAAIVLALLFGAPQALLLSNAWGTDSFARLFDPLYAAILWRSLVLAGGTTLLTLLVGFPVAWALVRAVPERLRGVVLLLLTLPLWTSVLVKLYAWVFLLRAGGLVSQAGAWLGFDTPNLLYTTSAVAIGQLYIELPYMVLPIYASLERIDPSLLDAASDLGASPRAVLTKVVIPLAGPGIAAGCVLVFVPSLGSILAPDLLGGAKTAWVGTLIASQFGTARDPVFGSALAFALSVLTVALFIVFRRFLARAQE
jgi:ABC-type spermidine/putrescine transport system permease subunit I